MIYKKTSAFLSFLLPLIALPYGRMQPVFGLFTLGKSYYNPAFTCFDSKKTISVIGNTRYAFYQKEKPISRFTKPDRGRNYNLMLNAESPFFSKGRHQLALGVNVSYQSFPNAYTAIVKINLSYRYQMNKRSLIAGVSLNAVNENFDFPYFNPRTQNEYSMNTSAGIVYKSEKRNFTLGFSSDYISERTLRRYGVTYYQSYRDYYLISGLDIPLSEKLVSKPCIIIFANTYNTNVQGHFNIEFQKKLTAGIGFNYALNNVIFNIGWRFQALAVQYCHSPVYKGSPDSPVHSTGIIYAFQ